jgi:hypothetical protein
MGQLRFPVEGGCACGSVRYRLYRSPLSVYRCHCKDCQPGSGWSMSMPVESAAIGQLRGTLVPFERVADSGRKVVMFFCAHCHTWLWNQPAAPGMLVVRAGTLDSIDWAEPVGDIWTNSKAKWAKIDPSAIAFAGQPDDRQPLYDAWSRNTGEVGA